MNLAESLILWAIFVLKVNLTVNFTVNFWFNLLRAVDNWKIAHTLSFGASQHGYLLVHPGHSKGVAGK